MQKLKSKAEICKLPSTTLVFLPRYREARKLPPNPRWSPSQGIPRKGPSFRLDNSMDSFGSSPRASGSPTCLPASLSRMLPAVFTIKLPAETPRALFPSVHGGGRTTNAVGAISQDFKPSDVQLLCSQAWGGKSMQTSQTLGIHLEQAHKRWSNQPKHFAKHLR